MYHGWRTSQPLDDYGSLLGVGTKLHLIGRHLRCHSDREGRLAVRVRRGGRGLDDSVWGGRLGLHWDLGNALTSGIFGRDAERHLLTNHEFAGASLGVRLATFSRSTVTVAVRLTAPEETVTVTWPGGNSREASVRINTPMRSVNGPGKRHIFDGLAFGIQALWLGVAGFAQR